MDSTTPRISTTEELRAAFGDGIPVTLPSGHTVLCRKPDFYDQILHGVVAMPLLRETLKQAAALVAAGDGKTTLTDFFENGSPEMASFIDQWVCLAAKTPRIVQVEADAGPQAIWVGAVPLEAKTAIFEATFDVQDARRQAAAGEFRGSAVGARGRPDGPPLQPTAVNAVGDSGPA